MSLTYISKIEVSLLKLDSNNNEELYNSYLFNYDDMRYSLDNTQCQFGGAKVNINKLKNVELHFNNTSLPLIDIILSSGNKINLDENTIIEIQNYDNVIGLLLMDINDTGDICGYSDKYKFSYKVHRFMSL